MELLFTFFTFRDTNRDTIKPFFSFPLLINFALAFNMIE
mgnify:CR=1 FL=1